MSSPSPNSTLDPCSQWIIDHQNTTFEGDNTTDIELEWLRVCIGDQRLTSLYSIQSDINCLVHRLSGYLLYPLTCVYITMGVTGTLGNVMVCTVIAR